MNGVITVTNSKKAIVFVVVIVLSIFTLTGCKGKSDVTDKETTAETTLPDGKFNYSSGIRDDGFWDIKALDYIESCEYMGVSVPSSVHVVSESDLQAQIDSILNGYATEDYITNRPVKDGDTVNIDFVGSVDGVEFEGGSTGGRGEVVTIGVTQYIDDFLEQLIGHSPGESFDIEVTFPENYGNEELNGKDAVFAITLNHIIVPIYPELTDAFVAENYTETKGWTTVADMKKGISGDLKERAVIGFLQDYIIKNSTVKEIPELMKQYCDGELINEFSYNAQYYNMELEDFLSAYEGIETVGELKAKYADETKGKAEFYMLIQAIAEEANLSVDVDDVAAYFSKYMGTDDYSSYEEMYGMPYLKSVVIYTQVMEYVMDNAVLE